MSDAPHLPVLLDLSVELLQPAPGRTIVDATFGAGGHTKALLQHGAEVVAIDQDPAAERYVASLDSPRVRFVNGNFRYLARHLDELGMERVDGVLCDLGVSSMQLDEGERGFAFRQDGPLDMRMGANGESAADVVNEYPVEELAAIIFRYGEERHSRRIARSIVEERRRYPITTTGRLAEVVARAYPPGRRREHPARRTFQALRIYVNDELGALSDLLSVTPDRLAVGGRFVVIAYHSLEDRLVKHAFRDDPRLVAVHKKPLRPEEDETEQNPRARSARLRAAERSVT